MIIQYGISSQSLKTFSDNATVRGLRAGLAMVYLPRDSLIDTQPDYSRLRAHEGDRMCREKYQGRAYKRTGGGEPASSMHTAGVKNRRGGAQTRWYILCDYTPMQHWSAISTLAHDFRRPEAMCI